MEAMVELPMVTVTKTMLVKDQIACWLSETAGSDEAAVRTATLNLETAETAPKFPLCLLELAAGKTFHPVNLINTKVCAPYYEYHDL